MYRVNVGILFLTIGHICSSTPKGYKKKKEKEKFWVAVLNQIIWPYYMSTYFLVFWSWTAIKKHLLIIMIELIYSLTNETKHII